MNLPPGLPELWHWLALAALVPAALWAALRAPWGRLASNEGSHVYLGAIVALSLLWALNGRVGPAIHFHLLGATLAYLMFGLPLAQIGRARVGKECRSRWSPYH